MSNLLGLAYGESDDEDKSEAGSPVQNGSQEALLNATATDSSPSTKPNQTPHRSSAGQPITISNQNLPTTPQPLSNLIRRRPPSGTASAGVSPSVSPSRSGSRFQSPYLPSNSPHSQASTTPRVSGERLATGLHQGITEPVDDIAIAEAEAKLRQLLKPPPIEGEENSGIPPEPDDEADEATQAKIAKWLDLKGSGMHFNARLEQTHAFRNPSIMSKLIEYLGLDETGSNYPKEIYDPHGFPEEAFFDRIAHKQATERPPPPTVASNLNPQLAAAVQKAQQRAIQFVSNLNKGAVGGASVQPAPASGRKRSKWDEPSDPAAKRR
ncbi:uncharacterized protein SPPG_03282 [Spizellomyces punctatus DAOM BR117]|uniref:HCNGP-like protein n=1 Tax=Spizellomyces punctatus (strain DAOM BR117) TaxID=645134 RepID=A0A0L0HJ40_SPIPD|nr:uncharacterized protein SPPG_03282 [Spizellomyces punctatus DAOM BR117]KND01481.1 hypothetical protein SPPG_03282 [Spizellomyces punctatus DAOM BR117]|eukprot:XP_016609520.1 hypothetical protein SPPG_03282 [Spizellomyces punctatus DAOM BR117]